MANIALGMAVSRRATRYSPVPASSRARSTRCGVCSHVWTLLAAKAFDGLPWQAGATLAMTRRRLLCHACKHATRAQVSLRFSPKGDVQ